MATLSSPPSPAGLDAMSAAAGPAITSPAPVSGTDSSHSHMSSCRLEVGHSPTPTPTFESEQVQDVVHCPRPYRCKTCRQRFHALSHLQEHCRLHSGYRPYPCQLCTRTYRQRSQLQLHMRTHAGNPNMRCRRCSLSFPHMAALASHMLREHQACASKRELSSNGSLKKLMTNGHVLSQSSHRNGLRTLPSFTEDVRWQETANGTIVLERVDSPSPSSRLQADTIHVHKSDDCESDRDGPNGHGTPKRDTNGNVKLVSDCESVAGPCSDSLEDIEVQDIPISNTADPQHAKGASTSLQPTDLQSSHSPTHHSKSLFETVQASRLPNQMCKSQALTEPGSMDVESSIDGEMPDDLSHHGDELSHHGDPPDNLSRHGDDEQPRSVRLDSFESESPPSLERMSPEQAVSPPLLTKVSNSDSLGKLSQLGLSGDSLGKLSQLGSSLQCSASSKVTGVSPQYLSCSSSREEASSIGNGSPPSDVDSGKPASSQQYSDLYMVGHTSPASDAESAKMGPLPAESYSGYGTGDNGSSPESGPVDADMEQAEGCAEAEEPTDSGIEDKNDVIIISGPSQIDNDDSFPFPPAEPQPSTSKQTKPPVAGINSFLCEFTKFVSQLEKKGIPDVNTDPEPVTKPVDKPVTPTPKSPIRIKIKPPRPPAGSGGAVDQQRNIFTILQAPPDNLVTMETDDDDALYNLRPKRKRNTNHYMCECCFHHDSPSSGKKAPNARRLLQQMGRVEHLRQRVCVLFQILFPSLLYPRRFCDTTHAVESLMDQVIAAAKDQEVENLQPGGTNLHVSVVLCKSPRKCLHQLRRKVVHLVQVLLPGVTLETDFDRSGRPAEELLETVIASNAAQ